MTPADNGLHASADPDQRLCLAHRRCLEVRPVGFKEACAFIDAHHRHHGPPRGHKYSLGAAGPGGELIAVAMVGRPVAHHLATDSPSR